MDICKVTTNKEDMNIVIVGHVDHGKSTIIGRLLADTNSLPKGKLELIKENCRRNAKSFEYAFILDALKDEQAQGITIDIARTFFQTEKRNYVILDSPGHIEFLKNMITGASRAQAALLVVDANEGIKENSRRHGYMLSVLGIRQVAVIINKMDLVNYDFHVYEKIVNDFSVFLNKLDITVNSFIPASGFKGDNIALKSHNMKWFKGKTVLEVLDSFEVEKKSYDGLFRMPVQDVYKFTKDEDTRRIVAGTILSGTISIGDEVVFYPSEKKSKIKSIEVFNKEKQLKAYAENAIGFTMEEQVYVKRGEVAVLLNQPKPKVASRIRVSLFWLGKEPMEKYKKYIFKLGTSKIDVELEEIIQVINSSTLEKQKKNTVENNEVADCILKLSKAIAFDIVSDIEYTSRFVLVDNYKISGGGVLIEELEDKNTSDIENIFWNESKVTYDNRCKRLEQKGIVVWLTGLSGAGKSTIATEVEKELVKLNKVVYVLDGDNIRHGLCSDLGFSKEDRDENIRRIAEVSALFKDAGFIVVVACISPSKKMREFAKKTIGEDNFIEIYIKADIETCIKRDPKGLYIKAKYGEIKNFTGIESDYEVPERPNLIVDTSVLSIEEATAMVLDFIIKKETKSGAISIK